MTNQAAPSPMDTFTDEQLYVKGLWDSLIGPKHPITPDVADVIIKGSIAMGCAYTHLIIAVNYVIYQEEYNPPKKGQTT